MTTWLDLIPWLEVMFWIAATGLVYIYAGYPLVMLLLSRRFPLQRQKRFIPRTVSVVISVHNEAARLPEKLANLLALEQSDCLVEILIGSDGSTDETESVLAAWPDGRVKCIPFAQRRGKPAVINDLIARCQGEIVLLTDARQMFDPGFLQEILSNFADPQVGVVSGELVLRGSATHTTAAEGIGFYWKYEKFLRRSESCFRGVPGATGACYAILKQAFRPIAETTILDDVAIPMTIVQQGYQCVFESAALAYDDPSQSSAQEAIRKRRTIAGAAQLVRLYPQWLSPLANRLWFEFVSHKLLRLLSPVLLLICLIANVCLVAVPPYAVLLSLQFSFYMLALCGWWYQQAGWKSRCFGTPLMFLTLNLTTALALWDACRARYQVTWQKAHG